MLPPLLERLGDGSPEASPRGLPPPCGLHGARRHRLASLVPPTCVLGTQRLQPVELALERSQVLAPLEARLGIDERVERRRRRIIARPGQRLLVDRRVARRQRSLCERHHGERVSERVSDSVTRAPCTSAPQLVGLWQVLLRVQVSPLWSATHSSTAESHALVSRVSAPVSAG